MLAQLRKFAPLAFVIGYLALYYNGKGFDRIIPDITGITVEKLMSKTSQLTIVVAAAIGLYIIAHVKGIPAQLKPLVIVVLYFVIGYNLALAVDPPMTAYYGNPGNVRYVPPVKLNPYSVNGR